MDSLYFLIPIALLLTISAVGLYLWAVGNGQYEDLDNEGSKILFDDAKSGITGGTSKGEDKEVKDV